MHLTAPLHWSRSIGTNGRDPSELVVTIAGMRKKLANADTALIGDNAKGLPDRQLKAHRRLLARMSNRADVALR
jgi:hypothetical protein